MKRISPERWRAASPYLDEALELPEERRAQWLEDLRRRDAALAEDVEALFAARALASRESFLEGGLPLPTDDGSLAGQSFGAYTLVSEIGRGGMGTVWLARRSDGRFEGLAAVKLLNASLIGRAGEGRFRREGSILARLAHPHVARLLDAGVSGSDRPYLVLEYVEGEPIDRYCDERRLGIEPRVALFLDVLDAVSQAHANLIVHRDIKPSNVMVDRDGQVKLLDFGIAMLLEGDGETGAATALTHEAGHALTPQFAAPEQITGDAVTTATDVHALGTLLYLLLTGRHPAGPGRRTSIEFARAILEVDPPRPSDAASARAGGTDEIKVAAAARASTPDALRRQLRGDLDTIVDKALKKAPVDRYPSVGAFAEDLRRYLRHEPVRARPDTWSYRVGKFVRRNRAGVVAAAVVAAAALAGTAAILWQAREAATQRDIARAQLDRATAANEFLGFLITDATPSGRKVSASDLFAQGERLVDKQFADNPALRSEMLLMIGDRYLRAESWDKAIGVLERSVRIARDPGVRARALCSIAGADMAEGKSDAARSMMAKALADLPNEPQYALARAACLTRSSEFGYFDSQDGPMIARAREALQVLATSPATSAVERIDALTALAYGYYLAGDVEKADRAHADVMAALEKAGRESTLAAADTLSNWGLVHEENDVIKEELLYRRALELHRSVDPPDEVEPTILFNEAFALFELARYDEAASLFQEAIRNSRARGNRHIEVPAVMLLAQVHTEQGELARASAELAEVAPADRARATYAYSQGLLSLALGDAKSARDELTESVERFERNKPAVGYEVFALTALSRSERSLGRVEQALAAAQRAVSVASSLGRKGAPSQLVGRAQEELGEAELAAGDTRAARSSLRSSIGQLDLSLGPGHPVSARAHQVLASIPGD